MGRVDRALVAATYAAPCAALAHLLYAHGRPPALAALAVVAGATVHIAFFMSVLLHRYFAHGALRASRGVQYALAWLSCLAYQRGPLWWASKHRRHHAHCDAPKDPHSWSRRGWAYAFVGWTLDAGESDVDREFLGALSACPELEHVDRWWVLAPLVYVAAFAAAGVHAAYPLWVLLLCRLITLLFNVEYHPPSAAAPCKATDAVRLLSELVGESHHADHHLFPRRARRPGLDLAYHAFVRPLAALRVVVVWGGEAPSPRLA